MMAANNQLDELTQQIESLSLTNESGLVLENISVGRSVKYINDGDGHVMFLMRGVPGSGKSTIVKHLMKMFHTDSICSADQYFSRNGRYRLDQKQLKQAHEYCHEKAEMFCKEGRQVVIIDNTNIKKWEMSFYLRLAEKYSYMTFVLIPADHYNASPQTLAHRNTHGVDAEIIEAKRRAFEPSSPKYYGWFFNTETSTKLMKLCEKAVRKVEQSKDRGDSMQPSHNLHLTSCYLAHRHTEHQLSDLDKHIGSVDKLHISAVIISSRTVSARVQLDTPTLHFYRNDVTDEMHKGKPGYNKLPRGHAAHITLSKAPGVQSSTARSDAILSHLCEMSTGAGEESGITSYPRERLTIVRCSLSIDGMFSCVF